MKMNTKGNDYFETPRSIFRQLDDIFKFTLDVAANENNHLCEYYFTEDVFVIHRLAKRRTL